MSTTISLEDFFIKQAVEAKADYNKALSEWKSDPKNRVFEKYVAFADKHLESANKNLLAFIKTLPQGGVVQRPPSPGPFLVSVRFNLVLVLFGGWGSLPS